MSQNGWCDEPEDEMETLAMCEHRSGLPMLDLIRRKARCAVLIAETRVRIARRRG